MKIDFNPELILYNLYPLLEKLAKSPYLKIILVVVLSFVLLLVLAHTRKIFIEHALRGGVFGFILGMVLILMVDLIIIVGLSDKTKLQKITSGTAGPEIVKEVALSGLVNLSKVLGAQTILPARRSLTAKDIINDFLSLSDSEAEKVRDLLCPP